jgi:hypothetical protein
MRVYEQLLCSVKATLQQWQIFITLSEPLAVWQLISIHRSVLQIWSIGCMSRITSRWSLRNCDVRSDKIQVRQHRTCTEGINEAKMTCAWIQASVCFRVHSTKLKNKHKKKTKNIYTQSSRRDAMHFLHIGGDRNRINALTSINIGCTLNTYMYLSWKNSISSLIIIIIIIIICFMKEWKSTQ